MAKLDPVTILVAAGVAGLVLWLLFARQDKASNLAQDLPISPPAPALPTPAGSLARLVPQGKPEPVYTGPQPSDLSFQEYNQQLSYAPLSIMRSNEYLSQANPELAAWDSAHLLPNSSLSNCQDGAITDGPTFNQLQVFSGNKLFEATMAERYFMESTPRKVISLADLRPLPLIASSSATAVPWNQSSLGLQDVTGGLTHYNTAFCGQNSYPASQISSPLPGATTNLAGNPVQSSV